MTDLAIKSFGARMPAHVYFCDGCGQWDISVFEKEGVEHWRNNGLDYVCGRDVYVETIPREADDHEVAGLRRRDPRADRAHRSHFSRAATGDRRPRDMYRAAASRRALRIKRALHLVRAAADRGSFAR